MLESFLKYIENEKLFDSSNNILLAVSGGVDSMVMLHLFQKAKFQFSVAHCNFHLRGEESDGDEKFVVDYCDENNIRLFVNQFDTKEYALQEGISIEMAARDLRYGWFNELLEKYKFDYLATAHHQDDVIETFFINLSRGTGIRGLSGIKPKAGKLIRPVLFADRLTIRNYAALHQLKSREDSTNSDTNIQRNFIRHKIIPVLDDFNSVFRKNILKTVENLNQTDVLFQQRIEEIKQSVVSKYDWGETIRLAKIVDNSAGKTILFELLRDKGFSSEQVEDVFSSLTGDSGKRFFSETYRLVKDRDELIITPKENQSPNLFYIEKGIAAIDVPISMKFEVLDRDNSFHLSKKMEQADFDLEKLEFPLVLRKWKEGEYFQPLGMSGFKKLSDFFIDEKYSIPEKENAWILSSGHKIVWIVGKRIDDRFKIGTETQKVLRIRIN